jgi:hypothetical protein
VGRKISDGGDSGTPGYRREWQGILRLKSLAMVWLWKLFGDVISFGSGQVSIPPNFFIKPNPFLQAPLYFFGVNRNFCFGSPVPLGDIHLFVAQP